MPGLSDPHATTTELLDGLTTVVGSTRFLCSEIVRLSKSAPVSSPIGRLTCRMFLDKVRARVTELDEILRAAELALKGDN